MRRSSGSVLRLIRLLLIGLAVCLPAVNSPGGEDSAAGLSEGDFRHEEVPRYEPTGSLFAGYRFLSHNDSLQAAEYIYPHSSVTFGIESLAGPLPHRYHLNAEYLSRYDFYADAGYAYSDLLLFRNILVGIRHNLDHFDYMFPGEPPGLLYEDRNRTDSYFLNYINNHLFLRLKTPDFPLHGFVRHRHVEREGKREERFLIGDFDHLIKTSQSRRIDWKSDALSLGANSHLGLLEMEYEFNVADFDPGTDNILRDRYPYSSVFERAAGEYPHNVIPETESSASTVRVHTSYTGGIVASGTLSALSKKNEYSGTESTVWKGAFDFSWIPDPVLGLFFRYRHRERDLDTPGFTRLTAPAAILSYPVRPGLSYNKDDFSLSARYRPLQRLTLFSAYTFSHLEREDVDEWEALEKRRDDHRLKLTAHARPLDTLTLKGIYEYSYHDDSSYNIEADHSNRLRFTATYLPADWLSVYANYVLQVTARDELRYLNEEPAVLLEEGEREGRSDRFLASLSFRVSPRLSVTTAWAYNRWKVEQDLAYGLWNRSGTAGTLPFFDRMVPYTDESHTFSIAGQYRLREDITLTADLSRTISDGEWLPGEPVVAGSSGSSSALEVEETVFSLGISKKMFEDWEIGLNFWTDIYDDSGDDLQDGELYVTTFSLRRYF